MIIKGGAAIWGISDRIHEGVGVDQEVQDEFFGTLFSYDSDTQKNTSNEGSSTKISDASMHTGTKSACSQMSLTPFPTYLMHILARQNVTNEEIQCLSPETQDYVRSIRSWYSYGIARASDLMKHAIQNHTYWSNPLESQLPLARNHKIYCLYGIGKPAERGYYYKKKVDNNEELGDISHIIDTSVQRPPYVHYGVKYTDGDGV